MAEDSDELIAVSLGAAFDRMKLSVDKCCAGEGWKYSFHNQIKSLQFLTGDYLQASFRDRAALADGDKPEKDFPKLSLWKKIPKRKRGFVDAVHRAEYDISLALDSMLHEIRNSSGLEADERRPLLRSFRVLIGSLDDAGVFLDQKPQFSADNSLPDDHEFHGVAMPERRGLFTRLRTAESRSFQR